MVDPEHYGEEHESLPFYDRIEVMTDFWSTVVESGFDVLSAPWDTKTSEFLRTNAN